MLCAGKIDRPAEDLPVEVKNIYISYTMYFVKFISGSIVIKIFKDDL